MTQPLSVKMDKTSAEYAFYSAHGIQESSSLQTWTNLVHVGIIQNVLDIDREPACSSTLNKNNINTKGNKTVHF